VSRSEPDARVQVLAGDIGGTNARLAIISGDKDGMRVLHERRYATADYRGLAPIVRLFMAELGRPPNRACFGIPCPVVDGRCTGANISWTIDTRSLSTDIGIPDTTLINDLHAVAEGLPHLGPEDLITLQAGQPAKHGVQAIIAAGTGLGQAFLAWTGTRYRVHDSEGGHASFSARNPAEWRLLQQLAAQFGHVSRERVISGPGLINIYRLLAANNPAYEQADVYAEMEREDPAAVIARRALGGTDALSVCALNMFVSAYGAQAGNLALTVMAQGGLFVAGGIAPRILTKLRDGAFMNAFLGKGRLSPVLARIPVHVIVNPRVGLIGAAAVALRAAATEPTHEPEGAQCRYPIAAAG
jgi:glucokinase